MKPTRPLLTAADLDAIEARYVNRRGDDAKLVLRLAGDIHWTLREGIDRSPSVPEKDNKKDNNG